VEMVQGQAVELASIGYKRSVRVRGFTCGHTHERQPGGTGGKKKRGTPNMGRVRGGSSGGVPRAREWGQALKCQE